TTQKPRSEAEVLKEDEETFGLKLLKKFGSAKEASNFAGWGDLHWAGFCMLDQGGGAKPKSIPAGLNPKGAPSNDNRGIIHTTWGRHGLFSTDGKRSFPEWTVQQQ